MIKKGIVLISVATLALSGCQSAGPKQKQGAVFGAVAGGLIGSQFGRNNKASLAAGLIGAVAGGLIGSQIGAQLDEQDRQRLRAITLASLKTGKSRSFRNSKTKVKATTKVVASTTTGGVECRTIQQDVVLANGSIATDTVKGCKGANGWSV